MLEKLRAQIGILERAAKDENADVNLDDVKSVMFDATQRIETLEKESSERKAEVEKLAPLADLGSRKIQETKDECIRLLTVVCEHSESKDMSRRDRMKTRFETESLDFDAIKRYADDAQAEFDAIFPAESRAIAKKDEDLNSRVVIDVSPFKIKK